MWMGTYPSNPALVLSSGEELQKVLDANAESMIGEKVMAKFGTNLPFLPKILSMEKALPLQIHPDKELARMLHERDPEKFTDTNHKPEIAVALFKFEAFAGFMPLGVIWDLFQLEPLKRFSPKLEDTWNRKKLKELSFDCCRHQRARSKRPLNS
ncbi:MAG: hypothetical protein M1823_003710 [Watsoniomyces obsoletus]|nr:MAG: hypothetical protein M1823_003710 [Watsoniomyces obsoletus]